MVRTGQAVHGELKNLDHGLQRKGKGNGKNQNACDFRPDEFFSQGGAKAEEEHAAKKVHQPVAPDEHVVKLIPHAQKPRHKENGLVQTLRKRAEAHVP